jgi:hypothetical protein
MRTRATIAATCGLAVAALAPACAGLANLDVYTGAGGGTADAVRPGDVARPGDDAPGDAPTPGDAATSDGGADARVDAPTDARPDAPAFCTSILYYVPLDNASFANDQGIPPSGSQGSAVTTTTGRFGGGAVFATGDHKTYDVVGLQANSGAVSFWAREVGNAWTGPCSQGAVRAVTVGGADGLTMGCVSPYYGLEQNDAAVAVLSAGWNSNQWNHVAFSWSGASSDLYVNGNVAAGAGPAAFSGATLRLGSGGATQAELDEVVVFGRTLTPPDVSELGASRVPVGQLCSR